MSISVLLSTVAEIVPDRVAAVDASGPLTYADVQRDARRLGARATAEGADCIAYVGTNSAVVPLLLFAAAEAGVPFAPLNYRLADDQLRRQTERLGRALIVTDGPGAARIGVPEGCSVMDASDARFPAPVEAGAAAPSDVAVWLFTSGTTGEPKIVELSHENLTAYILSTVEMLSAPEGDATLVSVPPYHIAGIAAVLSSVFATRKLVYLESFDAEGWIAAAREHAVTSAMVVPTMLQRILALLEESGETLPALRALSYGGGRMPVELIRATLQQLPHVGFTNAYGLTETSSTIALLGPEDHREALASPDPLVQARLGSVGRPIPSIELEVRGTDGEVLPSGEEGDIWVRGPQISGAYRGMDSHLVDGWFATKDRGLIDEGGYLFLSGRADDVIVRGGENISPGEIEDVLREHSAVADVAVVAMPDDQWGEVPVAVVVPTGGTQVDVGELQMLVRSRLRSSRVPAEIVTWAELPHNEMGKLLRKDIRTILAQRSAENDVVR
ncbi:class I adenylate-forming enzyme family protein [Microbacterium sp. A93]|uniref:class I adenylate-forming enzyme family protein n=1 Tax=Microbacterium sp. A93 TaxID=3450716 RepID=UPI003F43938C